MIETYDVLGIPISAVSLDAANELIHEWANDDISRFIFVRDVHGIMQAQKDPELMKLHHQASLVTPDGMPLVWLGRWKGYNVSRTCGPDLLEHVLKKSDFSGLRHYFFGGKSGVVQSLEATFVNRFRNLRIVGIATPPMSQMTKIEVQAAAKDIQNSKADVVWIGISSPKQEFLLRDLAQYTSATLIGVGAAFDFHAGIVRRAPRWMQRTGFEWFWRLAVEPRRLWRRYLIMAPKFVWLVIVRLRF